MSLPIWNNLSAEELALMLMNGLTDAEIPAYMYHRRQRLEEALALLRSIREEVPPDRKLAKRMPRMK